MKKLFLISTLIALVLLVSCKKNEDNNLLGSYQSVSESEWDITLTLLENSNAEIVVENWEPGQYEKRAVEKKNARWINLRDKIVLQYDGKSDTLTYDRELSFSSLGKSGGSPGFLQSIPNYNGLFNDIPLWKLPHNF